VYTVTISKTLIPEIILYILFYGIALLFMPFLDAIALGILTSPLVVLEILDTLPNNISSLMNIVFPCIQILLAVGLFYLYFILTKSILKNYGKLRVGLFVFVFIISALVNFFFSYFVCAISVLKQCDPTRYLTASGLFEIYDFYLIGLAAFISANIKFNIPTSHKEKS